MVIRKYTDSDLGGVISCWERASKVGHPFLSKAFLDSERLNIPAVYLKTGETRVVEVDNSVVGFTILHGNEVGALFVEPEVHGSGIGSALINWAKQRHGDLKVEVFKDNVVGKNFYSNCGFDVVREYFHQESGMMMLCLKYTAGN